jgi:hypothetical protein
MQLGIIRGVVLRGTERSDLGLALAKLTAFLVVALVVAVTIAALRFRKRLG